MSWLIGYLQWSKDVAVSMNIINRFSYLHDLTVWLQSVGPSYCFRPLPWLAKKIIIHRWPFNKRKYKLLWGSDTFGSLHTISYIPSESSSDDSSSKEVHELPESREWQWIFAITTSSLIYVAFSCFLTSRSENVRHQIVISDHHPKPS